jgi:hypothetical protein
VIPLLLLQSCLEDPEPIPETIDTYHFYYNYLLEPYTIQWEVDQTIIGTGHSYGIPARAIVTLSEVEQEVIVITRDSESSLLIDSLSYLMYENAAYMIAILGTEEEPHLICEPMDTRMPSTGRVKFRFLHTAKSMGPVDIYIGGDQTENLALANVEFTNVSEYLEATEDQLWTSVIVTPPNSLPADSTILQYTANNIFQTGRIYLCIIGHTFNSIDSPYELQVDDQPVF